MTIEYKDSRRISALTADTKPTNVEYNSILVEKDTARRYWFSEALAPTFEDDFTSDNWTDSDSTIIGVNTSTQVLDFKEKDGNFNETSYISQTIGDKFVYRMKFNLSTITQTGNADSVRTTFALSNAGDIPLTTARDEVGITMRVSNTYNKFYAFTSDGAQIPWGGTDFSFTPATSTDYYLEIIGNEGTYTFNIYSDEYSTLIESESITDAGLVLDKLVVRTATSTTTNNQAQGTIDDVKFYNGVTTPTTATWTGNFDLTGLKSYYNFEQTSTTLTNMATSVGSTDSLGSSGDATGSGTITKGATGIIGNAWDFGGGKVTTSHQLIPTSGYWTYSTWVSLDDISTAGEEILRHESPTFEVWRNSGGLNVSGASGTINLETASNLANNTWYNIVLVHSSSGDISYLNGVSKSTANITSVPTGTTWYLGGRSGSSEVINGKIDETIVWSRALSSSEVSSLYNSGRGKIVY